MSTLSGEKYSIIFFSKSKPSPAGSATQYLLQKFPNTRDKNWLKAEKNSHTDRKYFGKQNIFPPSTPLVRHLRTNLM